MSSSEHCRPSSPPPATVTKANTSRENPCLFAVGVPRSGTTLLQRMLNHHPRLAIANDTHFIPRVLEIAAPDALGDAIAGLPIPLTDALVEATRSYHRFPRLGLNAVDVEDAAAAATYGEFVRRLYVAFAASNGKPLAGEKTPDYVRHLPLLAGLFPAAQFLHIIRDGRDVALSLLQWAHATKGPGRLALWKRLPVAACALWWKWMIEEGRHAARRLPAGTYAEISYERLAANSDEEVQRIADFLNLRDAQTMLAFHLGKTQRAGGRSAKQAWLPPTRGLRDWRRQMNDTDLALFEALAGDTLEELGYPRSVECIPPASDALAEACRQWWQEHLAARQRKLQSRLAKTPAAVTSERLP